MIAGVLVGGGSLRMGGRPKGWLLAPSEGGAERVSILERTVALARGYCDEVVLVGSADAYAALGVLAIPDATTAGGEVKAPLAGLVALLEHAGDRTAIALACDMPYLTSDMFARLATFSPDAAAVAPRDQGVWSPLFARYDAPRVAVVARAKLEAGERSLRAVLEGVATHELLLSPEQRRALRDWDAPGDVEEGAGARP